MVWRTDWPYTEYGRDGAMAAFNTKEAAIAYVENHVGVEVEKYTITSACPDGGSVLVEQLRARERHDGLRATAYKIVEWEISEASEARGESEAGE